MESTLPGAIYGEEYRLQWGHGIAAVESCEVNPVLLNRALLQWGHGIAAVESIFIALKG